MFGIFGTFGEVGAMGFGIINTIIVMIMMTMILTLVHPTLPDPLSNNLNNPIPNIIRHCEIIDLD